MSDKYTAEKVGRALDVVAEYGGKDFKSLTAAEQALLSTNVLFLETVYGDSE